MSNKLVFSNNIKAYNQSSITHNPSLLCETQSCFLIEAQIQNKKTTERILVRAKIFFQHLSVSSFKTLDFFF